MATLSLYLLGPPRFELDGEPFVIRRRKAVALLTYLAVNDDRQQRDTLATLLWPESAQQRARKALRRDLSELNLALGGNWLNVDREGVALRNSYWLDTTELQRYLAAESLDLDAMTAATDLYRGDFLAGFTLPDCPQYDEWQYFQSESLRHAFSLALEKFVGHLSDEASYEVAIPFARRWLALDSLHEPAHRHLMRLYAQTGQQAAALRQYDVCCQILEDELGVVPSEKTTALREDIRTRTLAIKPPIDDMTSSRRSLAPRQNLPIQTTTFVGRVTELADIRQLLVDEPSCRLLNLVGPGGIGKTRLALAATAQILDAFSDGACFVSLAPIGEVEYIITTMAEALRLTFFGQTDPKDQLLGHLSRKQLLLVMDNFEHLLDGVTLLSEILSHAPEVVLLATSRERLNLQEEWVFTVQGLTFPGTADEMPNILDGYSAVQLFTQRARQTAADFAPSVKEMADLGRICQLVEGMPLGLELAASWVRTLSCKEIAAEIEHSLDFLATPMRNVPERHRSLRVVFEQTWERLSPTEQAALMRLSVFRGGCTRGAAAAVAGATLLDLSSLLDKTLLRRANTGRYELHELIRQFAEAKLQADPEAVQQTHQRHRNYFITFLEARTAGIKGERQAETLSEIEADIDNVRLAWRRVVASGDGEPIERSAECLFIYYLYRNGYDEAQTEFGRAVSAFAGLPDARGSGEWPQTIVVPEGQETFIGFLLAGLGYFVAHRRNLRKGQVLLEQTLPLLRRAASRDRDKEAFALLWLGWAHYFQGQLVEGRQCASESLALLAHSADDWAKGWALLLVGACLRDRRPKEAVEIHEAAMKLCRQSGDMVVLSYLGLNMCISTTKLGRYVQAQQYIELAVNISEKMDNILGLAYSHFSRGQLEIAQGKYPQARRTLRQALSYFNEVGTVHASRARIFLGRTHHLQGEYDLASQLYVQGLDGIRAANSEMDVTYCFNFLGKLAHDRGNLAEAERLHREGLALLQEPERKPALVGSTVCFLGQVMVDLGESRWAEAWEYFRQALALAAKHQLAPIALDVCTGVAQLLAKTEDKERAIELLILPERHEASTFETREKARRCLIELGYQFPLEKAQVLNGREQGDDLWSTVQTLLSSLTANT